MVKRYELLESKIKDPYIREALRRVKASLKDLDQRSEATTITNNTNVTASSVWVKLNTNANASGNTVIDQTSVNNFSTIKYIISVENNISSKVRSMEIMINNESGSLKDVVFARIGTGIDFDISVVNNSGIMQLIITNNEANGLAVNIAKLVL